MDTFRTLSKALLCTTAIGIAMPLAAQEIGDIDLDAVELGNSKRDVHTETATSVTTINQEEINDRQAGTIAELIDSVPGVSLINGSTPQGSGINIRGFGANTTYGTDQKVLVLVDGATAGSEELYRIGTQLYTDPALYKHVSVIRGAAGAFEYGSGAIGGAVILETKDASDFTGGEPGVKLRQTLEFGTNGNQFTSSSILAWQPTEDFEVLGNYVYRSQNNQRDGDGNSIDYSEFALPSWLLKAKKTFGQDGDHSFELSYSDTQSEYNGVPYDEFTLAPGFFGFVDRDVHTRTAIAEYNFNPADNDLINLTATLSYADQEIFNTQVPQAGSALLNADHRYETTKLTVKNTSLFDTGAASHDLRAGIEVIRKDRVSASAAPGGTDERFAVFLVDEITIGDGLTLTPALRYETQKISNNDDYAGNNAFMGALSAHYKFDNGFAIFGSVVANSSLAIIDDQFDLILNPRGNPDFIHQIENAKSVELGVSYDRTSVFADGDDLRVKATAYRTELSDVTSYSGISDIETTGLELEASYSLESGFYVDFNGNIQEGDATASATGLSSEWGLLPANEARVTLGKRFGEEVDLSWEVVSRGSRNASGLVTDDVVLHNLRATFKPQNGVLEGTEIRVGVENLLDESYQTQFSVREAPGRNIKFTLAKTF